MKNFFLFLFLLISWFGQAQISPYNHKDYLTILSHSKDSLYSKILGEYKAYIDQHGADYKVQMERCKFIENAYYDYTEEYNPKYEEADQCIKELVQRFPNTPEVLIYRAEGIYGDSSVLFLKKLEKQIHQQPEIWNEYAWKVYESLAQHYNGDSNRLAIRYGEKAVSANDTLDLSLFLARLYKQNNQTEKAIEILSSKTDSTEQSWTLNQKGKLYLELGATDKAIETFRLAQKDTSGWQDSGSLAQALIDNGLFGEARNYLVKEIDRFGWSNGTARYKLLDYDLKFGEADSAKVSYQKFVEGNFWNDPIGIARLRLFVKAPLAAISFSDLLRLLVLLLVLFLLLIIPYVWILPIHFIGLYLKNRKGEIEQSPEEFNWGLRHLWVAFSLYFLVTFLVTACFDYPSLISMFNDSFQEDPIQPISELTAKITLYFFIGLAISTLAFVKLDDLKGIGLKIQQQSHSIGIGIGLAFLMRFGLAIYLVVIQRLGWHNFGETLTIMSINDDILSINQFYNPFIGFLFVVIIVPLYEEVLFRGVFLSSVQKHINFFVANVLQSFVFALAHQNLKLFIFYFVFGYLAGHYCYRTKSLITGVSLHVTNNLIAFIAMVALQKG
ncbi:MAG: CPBP family intramembrane metalloprotease [Cyclobacteriaceae bacterium]|nr:CPBP family intramembrane metalloprotease [Cyclobacteriaceae bacterium]